MPNKLSIMDHTGHSTVEFDKANVVSLQKAMRRFDELMAKGHTAAVRTGPGELKQVRAFDPNAEETVLTPPLVGG